MIKSLSWIAVSFAFGLLAQVETGLWEKSAWVIMCVTFLTGLAYLGKWVRRLVQDGDTNSKAEIERLRAEIAELRKKKND